MELRHPDQPIPFSRFPVAVYPTTFDLVQKPAQYTDAGVMWKPESVEWTVEIIRFGRRQPDRWRGSRLRTTVSYGLLSGMSESVPLPTNLNEALTDCTSGRCSPRIIARWDGVNMWDSGLPDANMQALRPILLAAYERFPESLPEGTQGWWLK